MSDRDDRDDDDDSEPELPEPEEEPAKPDPLDTLEDEEDDKREKGADASDPSAAAAAGDRAPLTEQQLDALLRDKTLQDYLAKIISDHLKNPADMQECRQVVLMKLKVGKLVPTDPEALRKYIGGIARNTAMTWFTRKVEGQPEAVPIDEERTRHKQEDAGQRRTHASDELEKLERRVPANQQGTWVLFVQHKLLKVSVAEIARKNGIESSTLHKRFARLQETLWSAGKGIGIVTILLLSLAGLWRAFRTEGQTARPEPSTEPSQQIAVPAPSTKPTHGVAHPAPSREEPPSEQPQGPAPGTPEAKMRAKQLREQARKQCAAGEWMACLVSYDEAKDLDSQGETPAVKAAHDKALEEVRRREP